MKRSLFLFLILTLPVTARAELPVAELKRDKPVNFATEVYPFLKANCLACHNTTKAKADLILESPQDMLAGGDTGPSIEPGKADNSLLFTTAAHLEEPTMPPANNKSKAKNLTPEQLALLKQWINEGAKGDTVSNAAPESWTLLKGPQPIFTSAISQDGRFAIAGRGQQVDVYDLRLQRHVTSLRDPALPHPASHQDLVQAVAFSPDGTIASGGFRTVKIWQRSSAKSGEPVTLPNEPSSLAVSPNLKWGAVGAKDGSIVLLKLEGDKPVATTVKDHAGEVTGLNFSADGSTLFSVAADKTVKRRSTAEPTKSVSLALPAAASRVALINQGKHLALGGADKVLRICFADLKTPMVAAVQPKPTAPSKAPSKAPAPAPKPAAKAPAPKTETKPAAKPPTPATPAPKPTPVPTEKEAAKKSPPAKAESKPAPKPVAKTEPAKTPAPKPASPKPAPAPKPIPAKLFVEFKIHAQPIVALESAKADGTEILLGYADGTVVHAKLDPARLTAAPSEIRRIAHGMAMNQLAVALNAPAGPRLATAGPSGPVKLWNLADGKLVAELKGDPKIDPELEALAQQTTVATRLKAHWDKKAPEDEKLWKAESEKAKQSGETIAKARRDVVAKRTALGVLKAKVPAATEDELTKAKTELEKAERTLVGAIRNRESAARLAGDAFARQTTALAAALEAEALAAAVKAEDEALRKAQTEAVTKTASVALSFSPDGTVVIEALKEGGLRHWSAADGQWLEDIPAVTGASFAAFTNSSEILATTKDKKVTPWSLPGKAWTLAKTLGDGKEATPFIDRVSALAFHPDGSKLLTGTGVPSRNGEITLWNTATWSPITINKEAHDDTLTSFAFSPDGSRFASGGTDQFVKVFDTATLTHQKTFEGHTSHVLDVDWNADDLSLASSGADLQVKVWDLAEGQQKTKVEGFQKEVSSVAFVGATDTLLTASGDKTLKLANAPLPEAGDTFLHTADVSDDGKLIIAGGQDSVLRVWDAATKKLVKAFASPEADDGKIAEK